MKTTHKFASLVCAAALFFATGAVLRASTFNITTTNSSGQTLGSGDTGTVTSTGVLWISGSTIGVTLTGNSVLTNSGIINQYGSGRAIRDNTGGLTVTIVNNAGALIQTKGDDVIQMNKASSNITFFNFGTLTSLNTSAGGAQAVDFNAITTGTNTLYNFSTGLIQASEADAVRPGVNGTVYNYGIIRSTTSTGSSSDGIDAQTNTGITITNSGASALIDGARHGITGGNTTAPGAYAMTISNVLGATIQGNNGAGINIDGLNANEVVRITNGGTITGNGATGDGDGIDVDGIVFLTNSGTIRSINSYAASGVAAASEGITVGGGTIINSGTISGQIAATNSNPLAVGRGITLGGIDTSGTPEPIYANSVITNSGLIQSQSSSGIVVLGAASGRTVAINNLAGGIIEGGGTDAAIQTGADNDSVTNSGTIRANGTGKAIDLGGGTNTLDITGGVASVIGDISGGTGTSSLTINPGAGNGFAYAGAISNFKSVEVKSGTVTLSGTNTYTGTTTLSGGKLHLTGSISNSATVINQTATLSGNGTVGQLTINNGGTLAPGNSPGTTTASSAVFNPGGVFQLQLNTDGSTGIAGTNWDKVVIVGTLDLTGLDASHQFIIDLQFLDASGNLGALAAGFDPNVDHLWTNVITTGGFTGDDFSSDYFAITSSQSETEVSSGKGTYKLVRNGNNLNLQYSAVPEPGISALLIIGGGLLALAGIRPNRKLRAR